LLRPYFVVREIQGDGPYTLLGLVDYPPDAGELSRLEARLVGMGWRPRFQVSGDVFRLDLYPIEIKSRPSRKIPWTNIALLVATFFTMTAAGAYMENADFSGGPLQFFRGLPFSVTLMAILGIHELGHYFLSLHHGVRTSLPYFIPAPNLFGTFGAVIVSKSPLYNRRVLLDIGVAGPLAGFVVAIAALVYGLSNAEVIEPAKVAAGSMKLGDSLLIYILSRIIVGPLPEGFDIFLGPVAFAGWAGLLVTALNLLPIGQLDGGHITYALFGRYHSVAARIAFFLLVCFVYFWPAWLFMITIIYLIGLEHRPPLDDVTPLNGSRKLLGWLAMVILVLCFIPVPISGLGLGW